MKLKTRLVKAAVCDGQREIVIVVDRQQIAVRRIDVVDEKGHLEQGVQSLQFGFEFVEFGCLSSVQRETPDLRAQLRDEARNAMSKILCVCFESVKRIEATENGRFGEQSGGQKRADHLPST